MWLRYSELLGGSDGLSGTLRKAWDGCNSWTALERENKRMSILFSFILYIKNGKIEKKKKKTRTYNKLDIDEFLDKKHICIVCGEW